MIEEPGSVNKTDISQHEGSTAAVAIHIAHPLLHWQENDTGVNLAHTGLMNGYPAWVIEMPALQRNKDELAWLR